MPINCIAQDIYHDISNDIKSILHKPKKYFFTAFLCNIVTPVFTFVTVTCIHLNLVNQFWFELPIIQSFNNIS